jgi:prepilin-type N-terminal cleavage/methylation domain-containing protein
MKNIRRGFTLIELLIVIAIIAIIAAVAFVALDPLTRFRDARDSARWQDVSAVITAIKVDQVDNKGSYLSTIANSTTPGHVYMLGTDVNNCETYDANCDTNVSTSTNCLDISGLVTEGYLAEIPVSPDGDGTWTSGHTGYTLQRDSNGAITVRSCESENSDEIKLAR